MRRFQDSVLRYSATSSVSHARTSRIRPGLKCDAHRSAASLISPIAPWPDSSAQPTMPPQKEPRTCAAGRVRSAASGAPRHARYLAARRRPPWPAEGTGGELAWTSDGHLSYHPCGMPPPTNAAIGTTSQQQVSAGWSHVDRLAGSSGRGGAASGGAGCRVLPKSSHRPWPDQGLEGPTLGHLAKLGRATALSPCLPCRGRRPVRSARARSTCVAASVAAAQRAC